jgi:hypothetical protein
VPPAGCASALGAPAATIATTASACTNRPFRAREAR